MLAAFFHQVISVDWRVFCGFCTLLTLVLAVCACFIIIESPIYTYNQGQFDRTRELFGKISKFNGKVEVDFSHIQFDKEVDVNEDDQIVEKEEKRHFIQRLKHQPEIFFNLFFVTILWVSNVVGYYIITFYLKYVPGSIFTLSYAGGLAEGISPLLAIPLSRKIGLKRTLLVAFSFNTIGSLMLWIFNTNDQLSYVFIFVMKSGMFLAFALIYTGNSFFFSSDIASTCIGICNIFCRVGSIFAPVIAEMPRPQPLIILAVLSFASVVSAFFVKIYEEDKI
jgi:Na+/melibiose symporter-like transporter